MTNQPEFDKPTDQWIDEEIEIPVMAPQLNEETGKYEITRTTKKVTQRTFYAHTTPTKVICKDHQYICLDKGKYLFKCIHCDWHRIAPPVTFKFDPTTGKLTYRKTGVQV